MKVEPYSTPTEALAAFTVDLSADAIPEDVLERGRLYILDAVGCGLAGSQTDAGRIMTGLFTDMGGRAESSVLGFEVRLPAPQATYINAFLANLLDLDDVYTTLAHPGLTAVFPALAVGERLNVSGVELLVAVIVGYEVALRVAEAIRPSPQRAHQVWGLSTPQVFGAAAAAGRILRLNRDKTRVAFGLAGLSAPVPSLHKMGMDPESRPVSWVKNNICWAAMGGVLAALQGQRGVMGNSNILEGDRGFWVMAGSDRYDAAQVLDGLGKRFLAPLSAIKPYGCCRWSHSGVEAAEELFRSGVSPAEIEAVEIWTFEPAATNLAMTDPPTFIDMQWSLPLLVAVALTGGDLRAGTSEGHLRDPKVRAISRQVRVKADASLTERFVREDVMAARITIRTRSGETRSEEVLIPQGDPKRQLSREQVLDKYFRLAIPVIGEERAKRLSNQILNIERVENISGVLA